MVRHFKKAKWKSLMLLEMRNVRFFKVQLHQQIQQREMQLVTRPKFATISCQGIPIEKIAKLSVKKH